MIFRTNQTSVDRLKEHEKNANHSQDIKDSLGVRHFEADVNAQHRPTFTNIDGSGETGRDGQSDLRN
jgi:hypothetical protein